MSLEARTTAWVHQVTGHRSPGKGPPVLCICRCGDQPRRKMDGVHDQSRSPRQDRSPHRRLMMKDILFRGYGKPKRRYWWDADQVGHKLFQG
jgi:hypothetical protein